MVGTLIGDRYLLKKKLGEGGSGRVYLCQDRKLHKEWAIKELPSSNRLEKNMELELLKRISCHVFPRIVDIVSQEEKVFLVMDYVTGRTLKEIMQQRSLSEAEVLEWAIEIAKGIKVLHHMTPPILYMDCKPDNIMLNEAGEIRLVDLGSVYICRSRKKQRISGTRFFAPKEIQSSQESFPSPDMRTDIYAFGMTLYYLLLGEKKEVRKNGRLRIREIHPKISWGMSHIIEKCTMENPKYRYASMEEVIEQLLSITKVGRWERLQTGGKSFLLLLAKLVCASGTLLGAFVFKKTGNQEVFLLFSFTLLLFFFLCSYKKICWYEWKQDVFCGSGKRLLFFFLLLGSLYGIFHITGYTAEASGFRKSDRAEKQEAEECLRTILYDSKGHKLLLRKGAAWEVTEDIVFRIPFEEIASETGTITISYSYAGQKKEYSFTCSRVLE